MTSRTSKGEVFLLTYFGPWAAKGDPRRRKTPQTSQRLPQGSSKATKGDQKASKESPRRQKDRSEARFGFEISTLRIPYKKPTQSHVFHVPNGCGNSCLRLFFGICFCSFFNVWSGFAFLHFGLYSSSFGASFWKRCYRLFWPLGSQERPKASEDPQRPPKGIPKADERRPKTPRDSQRLLLDPPPFWTRKGSGQKRAETRSVHTF